MCEHWTFSVAFSVDWKDCTRDCISLKVLKDGELTRNAAGCWLLMANLCRIGLDSVIICQLKFCWLLSIWNVLFFLACLHHQLFIVTVLQYAFSILNISNHNFISFQFIHCSSLIRLKIRRSLCLEILVKLFLAHTPASYIYLNNNFNYNKIFCFWDLK